MVKQPKILIVGNTNKEMIEQITKALALPAEFVNTDGRSTRDEILELHAHRESRLAKEIKDRLCKNV